MNKFCWVYFLQIISNAVIYVWCHQTLAIHFGEIRCVMHKCGSINKIKENEPLKTLMFSGTTENWFEVLFTHESGYFHYLLFGKFALETSLGLVSFSALLQVCGNSIELNGVELKIGYLSYSITNNYTRIKLIEHDADFFPYSN